MTTAWMVYLLLVGTMLAAGASVLSAACRHLGWPTRWPSAVALGGMATLALVAPPEPAARMRTPLAATAVQLSATTAERSPAGLAERLSVLGSRARELTTTTLVAIDESVPRAVARGVGVAWAVATMLLLSVFVGVNVRLIRARRSWTRRHLLGVPVSVSPDIGPAVLGFARAEIVVPRSLLERSSEEQRLILAHEREHLVARDHLLLGGACLVTALLPWHPAAWHLLARLRLAIELDCDARVLRGGASRRAYAALLIDVATHHAGLRIGALALTDGPSHLERRIMAMQRSPRRHALAYGTSLGVAGALLMLAACEAKVPTAADISTMDVASAQRSASTAGLLRTPASNTTDFFVNGVRVSADQARALEARNIGSIEVVKSELATGRDTIFVTTADRMPKDVRLPTPARGSTLGGESTQTFTRKVMGDSTEHMVAHVERELASSRLLPPGEAGANQKRSDVRLRTSRVEAEPLFIIDGKRATGAEMAALDESQLASVKVYKGESARALSSDPAAKNGVVYISTKRAKQN